MEKKYPVKVKIYTRIKTNSLLLPPTLRKRYKILLNFRDRILTNEQECSEAGVGLLFFMFPVVTLRGSFFNRRP